MSLSKETGASRNNTEKKKNKRAAKATPKIEIYIYIYIYILNIYREYLLCLQSNATCSFLQTCIDFVERLTFFHFEGSIIP